MNQGERDGQVMQRLIGGDDSALAELMSRWGRPIRCFIDRICGRLGRTDDIHQEVWKRVFLYRRRYKPLMPFRTYLFAITVNCCRTAMRQARARSQRLVALDEYYRGLPASNDPPVIDTLIAEERHALLHKAISQLPEAQRTVVVLYVLCDTNYKQIAAVLQKPPGTVRSHMHHALKKLRATLERMTRYAEGQVDHERRIN